jgi:hypothetical protein
LGAVGFAVGAAVGFAVGAAVGFAVGAAVGFAVGAAVGFAVGAAVAVAAAVSGAVTTGAAVGVGSTGFAGGSSFMNSSRLLSSVGGLSGLPGAAGGGSELPQATKEPTRRSATECLNMARRYNEPGFGASRFFGSPAGSWCNPTVQSRLLLSFVTLATVAGCSKQPPKSAGAEDLAIPVEGGTATGGPSSGAPMTGDPTGAPVVNYPAFEVLRDGSSVVSIQVRGPVQVTEQKVEGRIVYALSGITVPEKVNRLPLVTQYFPTQVTSVMIEQTPTGANVVIDLREPATSTFATRRNEAGTLVSITVPRSEKYAAKTTDKAPPSSTNGQGRTDDTFDGPPPEGEGEGQDAAPEEKSRRKKKATDEVRFRGGVALEGGVFAIPEIKQSYGTLGVHGDIGVQFNDLVGLYWVPGVNAVLGQLYGVLVASAILVDFTFEDTFTLGLGPDLNLIAAGTIGETEDRAGAFVSALAGLQGGGRLRLAVHPGTAFGEDKIRRKAFTLGADVRFLGGAVVGGVSGATGEQLLLDFESANFSIHPQFFLGYSAF